MYTAILRDATGFQKPGWAPDTNDVTNIQRAEQMLFMQSFAQTGGNGTNVAKQLAEFMTDSIKFARGEVVNDPIIFVRMAAGNGLVDNAIKELRMVFPNVQFDEEKTAHCMENWLRRFEIVVRGGGTAQTFMSVDTIPDSDYALKRFNVNMLDLLTAGLNAGDSTFTVGNGFA